MLKSLVLASSILVGYAIGSMTIILVHPTTAERARCRAHPLAVLDDQRRTENCAQQYEGLGFVRATDLSPDQKAKLNSKPLPIEVQQDITIREGKPK